ncbi:histidine phosphatase family protein [Pseudomonas sp. A-RE-19]|uniref:lipopolysaccharide core heptose(II)-phosphate phosphatase PmrG n=1 Tax=Pseudomonas sp. A-RE-19 TaxID=2832401 RepID=UPI003989A142
MANFFPRILASRLIKLVSVAATLVIATLVMGFVLWPRSPVNLGTAGPEVTNSLIDRWQAGEVVVLVRHTERCDQSSNPCLGPPDGITRVGSDAATAVGQGFMHLGMAQTDVLSSPATRTVQTSHYMFGQDAVTQEWLAICGETMRNDVVKNKHAHRNLVLVTHSGCISDFEAQTGFEHAKTSEYGSALFVAIADGQPQVLGIVNATDWHSLLSGKILKQ